MADAVTVPQGWVDEQIEGFRIMLDRDVSPTCRLAEPYLTGFFSPSRKGRRGCLRGTSSRATSLSWDHRAPIVAVERRMRSPHEVAKEAVVAVAVRTGVVVVVADEAQVQMQATAVGAATAATHGITHGKAKTRRDRRITIGNEDTTKR